MAARGRRLPEAGHHIRAKLDAAVHAATDLEAAQEVQRARKALFQLIAKALNPAA